MTKLALLTGAHGFIGRHVARHLAHTGWDVIGIGHGNWPLLEFRNWGLKNWHDVDVSHFSLSSLGIAPDVIVHCAGGSSVARSLSDPHDDFERTAGTTAAVLEYARKQGRTTRLVLMSSAAVYGDARDLPIPESAPIAPISPYGVHKCVAEQLCASYSKHYELSTSIVRLFSVYGPGLRKQLLWDACSKLVQGNARFGGTGRERRDWLHVQDAASLVDLAIGHATPQCVMVNGGTGISPTIAEVLTELARSLGISQSLEFSGIARPGDPLAYAADITRAQSWGWSPSHPWREGIREFVTWFKGIAS